MEEVEVKQHSKIGGSGAHRFWECPGCIILADKIGRDDIPSKYASEGTVAHKLAEDCLRSDEDAEDYIGFTFEADGRIIKVTQNMADAVQVYLDTIRKDCEKVGTNRAFLEIEKEFSLTGIDKDAFGTNDAYLHVPFDTLIVYEYKHGAGVVVEVRHNKQMLYYALGAIQGKEDVEQIELVIAQPRARHKDGVVRRITYSVDQLELFGIELKQKIMATKNPDALRRGGTWCKFCAAYRGCDEAEKNLWRGGGNNSIAKAISDFT